MEDPAPSPPLDPPLPPLATSSPAKRNSYSKETRQRVVDCARDGGNWLQVAEALQVPPGVARTWLHRYSDGPKDTSRKRGGSRKTITTEHVEFMCGLVDANNQITLEELASMVMSAFGVACSRSTAARALDGACYTLKKTHVQPQYMNTEANKTKRSVFLRNLLNYKSHGYNVYYVDETNFNLWLARTKARSLAGTRAVKEKVASGGENMHVTACISVDGLAYYENKFGANRSQDVNTFLTNMLRVIRDERHESLNRVVVVLDNAPCHTHIESVFDHGEFSEATALRLGPYSPMLNPIESVFSVFKSKVKSYIARERENIRNAPPGVTKVAHRHAYLQRASNMFITEAASAKNCAAFDLHTLRFHSDVFELNDMPVGK